MKASDHSANDSPNADNPTAATADVDLAEDEANLLFAGISQRAQPSAAAVARARLGSQQVWQDMVAQRQQRRKKQRWYGAIAASVLFASFAAVLLNTAANEQWPVQLSNGEVEFVQQEGSSNIITTNNAEVASGTLTKAISDSRLLLPSGAEIRLAAASQIQWKSESELELISGRVYIDTHEQADVTVVTTYGSVEDIGTRYLVDLQPNGMTVAVRSGATRVHTATGTVEARARNNEASIVDVDSVQLAKQYYEPASNERWQWIHRATAGYAGQQLVEVLAAIAADMGLKLEYASVGDEAALAHVTLTGKLADRTPTQALELIALSSNISWQIETGALIIKATP